MNSDKKNARIAGLWYLAIAIFYSFSMIYVDSAFYVSGDTASTVKNIQASGLIFRLGFFSCLLGHVSFLFLANALYRLFSPADKNLSRLMVILVVAGVSVAFLNRLHQLAALLILGSPSLLSAFEADQVNALAMLFLDIHRHGEVTAILFWALWLLPLGVLIIKSNLIPKTLGVLLILTCACYLVDFVLFFFFPDLIYAFDAPLSVIETVSEVAFILWLLIWGVKKIKPIEVPR